MDDVQKEISLYPTNSNVSFLRCHSWLQLSNSFLFFQLPPAVLLRNLDTLTTEDSVLNVLQNIPAVAKLPIKSVRIGRDPLNNISRGICYLDMNNTSDAMRLFAGLSAYQGLQIDGREGEERSTFDFQLSVFNVFFHFLKIAMVSYCKLAGSNATAATVAAIAAKTSTPFGASAVAAAQWSSTNSNTPAPPPRAAPPPSETQFSAEDIPRLAEYSASLYAKTADEHTSYLQ